MMGIISFSLVDFPKFLSHNYLVVNASMHLSFIKTTPKTFPEASHSNTKVLEKSVTTKIGVLHWIALKWRIPCLPVQSMKMKFSSIRLSKDENFP